MKIVLALLLTLVCGACDARVPTGPKALSNTIALSDLSQNEWQTWPIEVSANSCSPVLKSGQIDVHLVTRMRSAKDGSTEIDQLVNVRNGRMTDAGGNEYVFGWNDKFTQVSLGNTYQADVVERFRVLSKGGDSNLFFEVTLRIEWDGTQLIVTSIFLSDCRGQVA